MIREAAKADGQAVRSKGPEAVPQASATTAMADRGSSSQEGDKDVSTTCESGKPKDGATGPAAVTSHKVAGEQTTRDGIKLVIQVSLRWIPMRTMTGTTTTYSTCCD